MDRRSWWWAGGILLALLLVPLVGLVFAYLRPPGLVDPPPLAWNSIAWMTLRTLALAGIVSGLALISGTSLALLEARFQFFGKRWVRWVSIIPLAVPSYLLAAMVRESFAPLGVFGEPLGLEGTFTGFFPAVLVLTLSCTPYVHLMVRAALEEYPVAEEEAARNLGATFVERLRVVLVPHLRPTWAFAVVLIALYVVSDFGAVAVLNCEVLTWRLYEARGSSDAYLLGFAMMLCTVPLLMVIRWLSGREGLRRGLSKQRRPETIPLKKHWTPVVGGFLVVYLGLGVVLPVATLVHWVGQGLVSNAEWMPVWGPIGATARYATAGTVATLLVAAVPAWVVVRKARGISRKVLENGAYFTSALPGVLLAFALLHLKLGLERVVPLEVADTSVWGWAEAVGLLLVVGYVMRFTAEGYALLKPVLMRLDPRQEESARSLGASPGRVFRQVAVPVFRPGVLAAFLLLFVSIAKELPVTLMLLPTGTQTLAYRIFNAQEEASFPDVGLSGLILVALALLLQIGMNRRGDATRA